MAALFAILARTGSDEAQVQNPCQNIMDGAVGQHMANAQVESTSYLLKLCQPSITGVEWGHGGRRDQSTSTSHCPYWPIPTFSTERHLEPTWNEWLANYDHVAGTCTTYLLESSDCISSASAPSANKRTNEPAIVEAPARS